MSLAGVATAQQAGILNDFRGVYLDMRRTSDERCAMVMDMGKTSNKRTEKRAYGLGAGHARYRPYGEPARFDSLEFRGLETTNHIYEFGTDWEIYDREDDLTQSIPEHVAEGGRSLALVEERAIFDFINGTTMATGGVLPYVPNAADGLPTFSGSARFGHANGNIISGFATTDVTTVRTGVYAADRRFREFTLRGQPMFKDNVLDGPMLVIYSAADNLVFAEAFNLPVIPSAAGTASQSNILRAQLGGKEYTLWCTTRMNAGEMVTALVNSPTKPLFRQTRTAVKPRVGNDGTSDTTSLKRKEWAHWERRAGFGSTEPYGWIKHVA